MRDLIQCVQNQNKNTNIIDTIYAIKNAGFDGVFIQWYNEDWEFSQQQQLDLCRKLGLKIQFCHLGYQTINTIWEDGPLGDETTQRYLSDLEICKQNNIDTVVMHLQSKFELPKPNKVGLDRLNKIAKKAEELKIKVAFENTKLQGYLDFVVDNIKSPYIGICLDVGHYHCHFYDKWDWPKFKDRIFLVHLHDNDSTSDQHLLPFDGTLDWKYTLNQLVKANYTGPVTLESCNKTKYTTWNINDFYKESFLRAKKLQTMFEELK